MYLRIRACLNVFFFYLRNTNNAHEVSLNFVLSHLWSYRYHGCL